MVQPDFSTKGVVTSSKPNHELQTNSLPCRLESRLGAEGGTSDRCDPLRYRTVAAEEVEDSEVKAPGMERR